MSPRRTAPACSGSHALHPAKNTMYAIPNEAVTIPVPLAQAKFVVYANEATWNNNRRQLLIFRSFQIILVLPWQANIPETVHHTLRLELMGGSTVWSQKMMRVGTIRIKAGLPWGTIDCPPSVRA